MSKRTSKQTDPEVTSSAARETIRKNYAKIERVVSVESILPKLFARKVIGEYEKQEIEAGKTPFQKSHTLADSMTRKSGKQFEEFCRILDEARVYTEFAHALRSQYAEEIALIEARKGRGAVERSQEVPQKLLRDSASEQVSSSPQITATGSTSSREGNNTDKLGLSPDPVPNITTATLSQYDSLTQAQCDNIVSKLQTSLQMVDMPVVAEVLYADKILTPEEFGKLQDHSLSGRPRWLLTALRRTGKHGLKSFHRALQKTGGVAAQHREMLLVLVAKVEEVSGVKIPLTGTTVPPDQPLMKLEQPPQWTSPLGGGGNRKQFGQDFTDLGSHESSKKSLHAPVPPPPGQGQSPLQPSLHHSTPALTSPLSSVGLGGGVSVRQPPGGLEMSEGQVPQSQSASLHGRPATRQRQKESGEGKQLQPASLQGRVSPSPKPKQGKASGNGAKLDVINVTLLKACKEEKEDTVEKLLNLPRPDLNVACADEAGLSPLHYAVRNKLISSLPMMVQHPTFTLAVADKDGRTPLHYAVQEEERRKLLQLLHRPDSETQSGGDSGLEEVPPGNIQDKDGNTALHLVVERGDIHAVKALVRNFKCSVSIRNNNGMKPVHLAIDKGHLGIVKYLMKPEQQLYSEGSESISQYSSASDEEQAGSSEYLETASGSGHKSVVSTEQEGASSWGSSEMLVATGSTPLTAALYGFLQLKGDKMNKTRMEVRSATVMTGPQERSLMELKEQTRVLRERLETTQKKNSHLETEIQQHHIRESLRQAHLHPSEDEESDRRKYTSYRHEDLVEEIIYIKTFVQKFETVANESKAVAQRFSADLEAEKVANQALRDNFDVSRSLWEKRIRDLSATIRKRDDKILDLESKIEALKKKKGKEKHEERDELAGPLQRILREGAEIIMYRHSLTLQQSQQEIQAHQAMMAQSSRQPHPQALPWKEGTSPSSSLQKERPSPLGTGQDSEPAGSVPLTVQGGPIRMLPTSGKLSIGSMQSAHQFLSVLLRKATAQVHSASVVVLESTAKAVTTAILESAIEGRVKSVVLTPPLECVSMTIGASSSDSTHLVGPFPPTFTTDLRILGLLQNASHGLLADVLPSLIDPSSLPASLQGSAARDSLLHAATPGLHEVQNALQPFQPINMAQIRAKVVMKALTRLHSYSTKLPASSPSAIPVIQTVLTVPSLPDQSSYTAVSRLLPLLMPLSTMCMLRAFDPNDIVAKRSAVSAFCDPAVRETVEHLISTDATEVEGARVILGEIQSDGVASVAIKRQIDTLERYVSTTQHPNTISSEDIILPGSLTSSASKDALQNLLKCMQSLSTDSLPVQLIPVRWLLLLDALTEAGLQCVDITTVEEIASSVCRMSPTEVQMGLVRLTEMGHLMYYPQAEKLRSVVVLDRSAVATALVRLSQLRTEAPTQYLPSTVNGVVEECLLHSTFEGLPIPAEILTDILQHLCIIGEAAVTTAPFTLQHTHCRVFLLPALLPNVVLKPHLRRDGTAPNGSQPDRPPASSSPDPLTTSTLSSLGQEDPLVILSHSRVLLTSFIPALCQSLSKSPVYSSSGVFVVEEVAFNQIIIHPHKNVQLHVQVFEPHANILGSHSGIKVGMELSPQHLDPVIRHLMHAVSLVEQAYGLVGAEWATPCPQRGDSPHPLKLSAEYQSVSGRILAPCEVCGAQVSLSNLQRLMVDCCTKISSEKRASGRVSLADNVPSTAVSLSEVMKVVESLGEEMGQSQVQQVAHALGFTQSEVTSIEQVVGGGERASMMLLHLLLVWQEQKQAGREEARGDLAVALFEGGMPDAAAKLDQRFQEKVHQSSSARHLSPALEDGELDLVSSYIGNRWEQLAASLGFRDTDDPEFSDRTGEEACRMMLVQWREEQKGKNVRLTLSTALKELGLELLSQRIQTAAEAHSKTAAMRAD